MTARAPLLARLRDSGLLAPLRDRRGAVGVLAAFSIVLTAAVSMFVTDVARIQIARGRLQAAVDAAVLAAARDLGAPQATLEAMAGQVFAANMAGMQGDLAILRQTTAFDGPATAPDTVRVTVEARLALLTAGVADAMRLSDLTEADITVSGAARKRVMGAEVMMVLDNTGSMQGAPIGQLRTAAQTMTEALFEGRESVPNLHVGMVNYSAAVNIGRQHADWLARPLSAVDADFAPTRWKGCVRVRSAALAETDDPPAPGALFAPQFWPSSRISYNPLRFDAFYNANNTHRNIWPPADARLPAVDERQQARNDGYGPNLGCPAPILPLSGSRTAVLDAVLGRNGVAGIEAWHRGGTFGNLGLVWGWRALSPRWRGLWRRPNGDVITDLPKEYDTPFHNKIIVLMTDGANGHFQTDMTAYGRPGEVLAANQIDPSMSRLCQQVKRSGVIVFAITFGAAPNAATRNLYTACASDERTEARIVGRKYFHAPSGPELTGAFQNIAGQIQELRLVE